MGFFKFGKRNKKETIEPQKEKEPIVRPQISSPLPSVNTEKEKIQTFLPRQKNKKEDLNDLFKIDIYNIFKYDTKLVEEIHINGKLVEKHTLKLPELELSTFYRIDINKFHSGKYDLIFVSNVNEIRKEMIEFIDYCLKLYGADFMNKGKVTNNDYRDAALGVFSRIWYNSIRIENTDFTISLTLHNICPKKT